MKLHATWNDLIIDECERLTSGSINVYFCEFALDDCWDGYELTAVFSTGNRTVDVPVIVKYCETPIEVLRPNAKFRVGLVGVKGNVTKTTTYSDWLRVEQGAIAGRGGSGGGGSGGGDNGSGSNVSLSPLSVMPTGQEVVVKADEGKGFDPVTVHGDENLVPANIVEGVTIYGVEGTAIPYIDSDDPSLKVAKIAFSAVETAATFKETLTDGRIIGYKATLDSNGRVTSITNGGYTTTVDWGSV